MQRTKREFEVVYTSLDAPASPVEGAAIVMRARVAMVDSRHVKKAGAPVFFSATGDSGSFSMRSASPEALAALPLSFGSAIGHFGIFERGRVSTVRQ